jgi:hypothetical protein
MSELFPRRCGFCGRRPRLVDWVRAARAWWSS